MKITKKHIREGVFKYFAEYGLYVTNVNLGNGYFLFDFGKDSVVHFQIKGIRKWKFALWIRTDNESGQYKVEFFGEKVCYIDKFKPGHTSLYCYGEKSISMEIPKKDVEEKLETLTFRLLDPLKQLQQLKKSRHVVEYTLYGGNQRFITWLLNYIWFYDIRTPIAKFLDNYIVSFLDKIGWYYLSFIFSKTVTRRDFMDGNSDGWVTYPRYRAGLELTDHATTKQIKTLTNYLDKSKFLKLLLHNTDVMVYNDKKDRRGYYYYRS